MAFKNLFRKSYVNISFVGIGTVLNAGLGFLFLSAVAKTMPVDEFGKYALLVSLLIAFSKFLDFGTNSIFVADAIAFRETHTANTFISNKLVQLIIAVPLAVLVLFLFKLSSWQIVLYFSLGLLFYAFFYTLNGLFQKDENYLMLVLLSAVPALIKGVVAVLILLNIVNWDFASYFAVFSLSIGSTLIFLLAIPKESHRFKFDFSELKKNMKRALSPGVSQLITEGFPAVSNTIAKAFSGFANVGLFTLAEKISSAFVLISYSIFTVLLPKNAKRKREKEGYDYEETMTLSIGVVLLSFAAIAIARLFIPWFFENKYNEALGLLNILVFSGAFGAIHAFMENYFYVEEKTKYLSLISGGKLLVLLIASAFLVPILQLEGLAYANLIASAVALLIIFYIVFVKGKGEVTEPDTAPF